MYFTNQTLEKFTLVINNQKNLVEPFPTKSLIEVYENKNSPEALILSQYMRCPGVTLNRTVVNSTKKQKTQEVGNLILFNSNNPHFNSEQNFSNLIEDFDKDKIKDKDFWILKMLQLVMPGEGGKICSLISFINSLPQKFKLENEDDTKKGLDFLLQYFIPIGYYHDNKVFLSYNYRQIPSLFSAIIESELFVMVSKDSLSGFIQINPSLKKKLDSFIIPFTKSQQAHEKGEDTDKLAVIKKLEQDLREANETIEELEVNLREANATIEGWEIDYKHLESELGRKNSLMANLAPEDNLQKQLESFKPENFEESETIQQLDPDHPKIDLNKKIVVVWFLDKFQPKMKMSYLEKSLLEKGLDSSCYIKGLWAEETGKDAAWKFFRDISWEQTNIKNDLMKAMEKEIDKKSIFNTYIDQIKRGIKPNLEFFLRDLNASDELTEAKKILHDWQITYEKKSTLAETNLVIGQGHKLTLPIGNETSGSKKPSISFDTKHLYQNIYSHNKLEHQNIIQKQAIESKAIKSSVYKSSDFIVFEYNPEKDPRKFFSEHYPIFVELSFA